jgi:ectoine hydroxylase-related dioxygenase (phytanoyl-CoA dioxygenase family)
VYHTHLGVSPPLGGHPAPDSVVKRFHQDSGRVNEEVEGNPRPRLSLKVAYFLEGDPAPGNGNMWIVPGSHLSNESGPLNADHEPTGAQPISVAPGSALIFDRRLWHSKSPNYGQSTRKALFYGYAYRWLRAKDEMTVQHLYPRLDPIRRQLLGDGTSADGYYSPSRADLPLLGWLEEHDPRAVKPTTTVFA